jgi:hypothetical protein
MFSTPKALRVPRVKSLIVPRPIRKTTRKATPSVRGITAKSARRTARTITR